MSRFWIVPGLPNHLRDTYGILSSGRRLVTVDGERLVAYGGTVSGFVDDVTELLKLGLISRKRIGKRLVLILGEWEVVEKRFSISGAKVSEIFTDEMAHLLERYGSRQVKLLERAFRAFGTLRKCGKVASSVLLSQLERYSHWPAEAVEEGLRIYLSGGCAEDGKPEAYAFGIIRSCGKSKSMDSQPSASEFKSRPHEDGSSQVKEQQEKKRAEWKRIDQKVVELVRARYGESALLGRLPAGHRRSIVMEAKRLVQQGEQNVT